MSLGPATQGARSGTDASLPRGGPCRAKSSVRSPRWFRDFTRVVAHPREGGGRGGVRALAADYGRAPRSRAPASLESWTNLLLPRPWGEGRGVDLGLEFVLGLATCVF